MVGAPVAASAVPEPEAAAELLEPEPPQPASSVKAIAALIESASCFFMFCLL